MSYNPQSINTPPALSGVMTPVPPQPVAPFISVNWFGAKGDGATDDTAAINAALSAAASTGPGAKVWMSPGTYAVSSTITIPQGVTLVGQGTAEEWSVTGTTTPAVYPTRLLWTAGNLAGTGIVAFASGTVDAGIQDICIDGQLATGVLAASTLYGIVINSSFRITVRNCSSQNVGYGLFLQGLAGQRPTAQCVIDIFSGFNIGQFIVMKGVFNVSGVTLTQFSNLVAWNFYNNGINIVEACDNNLFTNVYLAQTINNTTGIVYNSGNPTVDNGIGVNHMWHVAIDTTAGTGQRAAVINNTGTSGNILQLNATPSSFSGAIPLVQNGGLVRWISPYNATIISEVDVWSGGDITGSNAAGFSILQLGATAYVNPPGWISQQLPHISAAVQKVEWVTYWAPMTASGAIQLLNNTDSTVFGAPIIPGTTTLRTDIQDVTAAFYALNGEKQLFLETHGNGATGPVIHKSFLRIYSYTL